MWTLNPVKKALHELKIQRPLPMGRLEFETWSNRIIRLAEIPGATPESLKFALADMILHLKPTQSFECDGYFVHCLRKGAANQVAHSVFVEIKKAQQQKIEDEKTQVLAHHEV